MSALSRVEKFKKYRADIAKKDPVKLVTSEIEKQPHKIARNKPDIASGDEMTSMQIISLVLVVVFSLGLLVLLGILWLGGRA